MSAWFGVAMGFAGIIVGYAIGRMVRDYPEAGRTGADIRANPFPHGSVPPARLGPRGEPPHGWTGGPSMRKDET